MDKLSNFGKADMNAVDSFVKEIQDLFPKYEVNINNVNDFSIMYNERINCLSCKGLSSCSNTNYGHCNDYVNGEFVSRECRYKTQEAIQKTSLIKTLYLPSTVLSAQLENYDLTCESRKKIYKHCVEFVGNIGSDNFSKGLYLYGSFSTGKTYSLAVIANELAKKNIGCLLIYFPDLVLDLKSALGTPRFDNIINMLKDIDVLMLDDIGSELMTPWLRDEVLATVINYRMMEHKPLYMSSNLNPNDLTMHLTINPTKDDSMRANRIVSRMTSLLKSINMDDSKPYKR